MQLLKNKTSFFIGVGSGIFLLGIFLTSGPFAQNFDNLSKQELFPFWIFSIIRDVGLIILMSTMIVSGLRTCRIKGIKSKGLILLSIGLLFNIGLTIFSVYIYTNAKYISENLFENTDKAIKIILKKLEEKDLSKENRVSLNNMLAKEYYAQQGKLVNVTGLDGKQKVYEPTHEDIEFKQKFDTGKKQMEWLMTSFYRSIFLWSIVLIISILFGCFTPIKTETFSRQKAPVKL